MGNLLNGKGLDTYYTKLSSIASANCAQTYSFVWNGRSFPEETEYSQIMATNAPYLRYCVSTTNMYSALKYEE